MRIIYAFFLLGSIQAIIAGDVGYPLITREATDTAVGYMFAYDGTFGVSGNVLTWAFDSSATSSTSHVAGHQITPFLMDPTTSGGWTITGIGATETVSGPGIYTFSFSLIAGSNLVAPYMTFGWYDGSATTANQGTIAFDRTTTSIGFRDFLNPQPPVLGQAYSTMSNFTGANDGTSWTGGRVYSVQFDPATSAPEPATWAMILGGFFTVVALRRRR